MGSWVGEEPSEQASSATAARTSNQHSIFVISSRLSQSIAPYWAETASNVVTARVVRLAAMGTL